VATNMIETMTLDDDPLLKGNPALVAKAKK
jgi:hypothetical protein